MNPRTLILAFAATALVSHGGAQGKLRFVQITDVHLFDAGHNCYEPDVAVEHDAAINGLKWAVDKINQENDAAAIDFVVITGDFGIANLIGDATPPHDRPKRNACHPDTPASNQFGPTKPETIETAAVNVAGFLRELNVRSIYLLPGNNDVPDNKLLGIEDPEDRKSYGRFVQALSHELRGRVRDLSGIAYPASDAPWDHVHGYWLIGLDTASFKPSNTEIEKSLPMAGAAPVVQPGGGQAPPCQDPDPDTVTSKARTMQLSRTAAHAANASGPFLLFTHIPDLPDPFPDRQLNGASDPKKKCSLLSSWMLVRESRKAWTGVISNPKLVAIFGGHFHSMEETQYGGPYSAVSAEQSPAVRNMYVAPPLALKNQWKTHNPRRGLLVVDVQDSRVRNAVIDWYGGIDPAKYQRNTPAAAPPALPRQNEWIKDLVAYLIVALLILSWDIVVKR